MSKDWHSLYRDPRWQKKRLEVLERAEWCCQTCGESELELQVHHGYYEGTRKPWEYEPWSLFALCDKCHEEAEWSRRQIKLAGMLNLEVQFALAELVQVLVDSGTDDQMRMARKLAEITHEFVYGKTEAASETHNTR
jgi:hypothetical protein